MTDRHFTLLECETCGDRYPAQRERDTDRDNLVTFDIGASVDWTVWTVDELPQCDRTDDQHRRLGGSLFLAVEQDADYIICSECSESLMGMGEAIHPFCREVMGQVVYGVPMHP